MARPERVFMRARKPWVRARRRLLGWKVRLLIGLLLGNSSDFRSCWSTERPLTKSGLSMLAHHSVLTKLIGLSLQRKDASFRICPVDTPN